MSAPTSDGGWIATETLAAGIAAALVATALTGLVRRYALARRILDVPNARSSHVVPTPRGGGLSIAAVLVLGPPIAAAVGLLGWRPAIAIAGGGAAVAAVGWADDRRGLAPATRAVVQFAAAAAAVALLGGFPALTLGATTLSLGVFGAALAALFVVWLVNLYNFMDGIDGLAASQGVLAAGVGAALLVRAGAGGLALVSALIAGACLGFLAWNRPPARIFMGDVGSGLLGFAFGALALASERAGAVPITAWVLLLGVLAADATLTLARRVAAGERWYEAHRRHAYQRAVQSGMSHGAVTAAAFGIAMVGAAGAWLVTTRPASTPAVFAGCATVAAIVYRLVERRRPMYSTEERAARRRA